MDKICPVVLRPSREILAFRHPLAGLQLVKGSIEAGERPSAAATRELFEEAGITRRPVRNLGQSEGIVIGDTWYFWLMAHSPLPDAWHHQTEDDGGHRFEFFWQHLDAVPLPEFTPPFVGALAFISKAVP